MIARILLHGFLPLLGSTDTYAGVHNVPPWFIWKVRAAGDGVFQMQNLRGTEGQYGEVRRLDREIWVPEPALTGYVTLSHFTLPLRI